MNGLRSRAIWPPGPRNSVSFKGIVRRILRAALATIATVIFVGATPALPAVEAGLDPTGSFGGSTRITFAELHRNADLIVQRVEHRGKRGHLALVEMNDDLVVFDSYVHLIKTSFCHCDVLRPVGRL